MEKFITKEIAKLVVNSTVAEKKLLVKMLTYVYDFNLGAGITQHDTNELLNETIELLDN